MVDDQIDEKYYLISFNSIIDDSDPCDIKAQTQLENFAYIGTITQHFEEMMGVPDRLPNNADQILNHMRLSRRFNPHRHIRLYGVRSTVEESVLRELCENDPVVAERAIKNTGIAL